MSAYVVVHVTVVDREKMKEYGPAATAIIKQHGGEFLAGGPATVLAGTSAYSNISVIRFPDAAAVQRWYHSPEYQALIPVRDQAVNCTIVSGGE